VLLTALAAQGSCTQDCAAQDLESEAEHGLYSQCWYSVASARLVMSYSSILSTSSGPLHPLASGNTFFNSIGRGTPRPWYLDYFVKHPGYSSRMPTAFVGRTDNYYGKVKVWCAACLNHRIVEATISDEDQVKLGHRTAARSKDAILEDCKLIFTSNIHLPTLTHQESSVWASAPHTGGWIACRKSNCLVHLRDCPRQPQAVQDQAGIEQEARNSARRVRPSRNLNFTRDASSFTIRHDQQAISILVNAVRHLLSAPPNAELPEHLEPVVARALQAELHTKSQVSTGQPSACTSGSIVPPAVHPVQPDAPMWHGDWRRRPEGTISFNRSDNVFATTNIGHMDPPNVIVSLLSHGYS
jgi:hypothetical protein